MTPLPSPTGLHVLQWVLAALRAQYWSYQQSHWQVKGETFYGDHLLFQRLYESVVDQIDGLAEKMVEAYGVEAVSSDAILPKFQTLLMQWDFVECLHARGAASEKVVQDLLRNAYDRLKQEGSLSLGMDDFLMATASEHETNQYLLGQVLRSLEVEEDWAELQGS